MCLVRPPGCRLCSAYAVAVGVIAHELVVACSTDSGYNAAQRSMRICMGGAALGYIIQDAGCRMQVQGELVMRKVYVEL